MSVHTAPLSHVKTPLAPAAIGPYSQGILVGNTLSGQLGIDLETGGMISSNIQAETERVLDNIGGVLKAAQTDFENVVHCTVYLTDINDYGAVNEIYARYFPEAAPAREAVEAPALPRGARVEISCIAVR